jgi:hypothetical protein
MAIFHRLVALLSDQLKQGLNPRDLALSFALGSTLGITPTDLGNESYLYRVRLLAQA